MRKKPIRIFVNNKTQKGYSYYLTEPQGKNFDTDFKPDLSPQQMLELGVFGGKYLNDCQDEYPKNWFKKAKLAKGDSDPDLNFFQIKASQSRAEWKRKGWIHPQDPLGWFQWYSRYYMGRRSDDDKRQIKRWKAIIRHVKAVQKNCKKGDIKCRPRQRQAILHWAIDSRKI